MRRPVAFFTIVLTIGAIVLASEAGARETIKIKACQTISQPGSYELVDNLTATGAVDCLVITADDVTIDLAGFSISGSGPSREGIRGGRGIAVRNGSITGFEIGVDLGGDSIVEGLRVFGGCGRPCGTGILATGVVKGNTVSGTAATGIAATGVITGNYVFGAGDVGIAVGEGSTVIGNTANQNLIAGFTVSCPSNLTDNTAVNNGHNLVLNGDGCHSEDNLAP
jgi:hypothetical protein